MLIGLISRVGSSRLPRKPLLDLGGSKCIRKNYKFSDQAGLKSKIYVLTSYLEADNEI